VESKNLWAPWRIHYIRGLSRDEGCFLCDIQKEPGKADENLIVWRTDLGVVVLNRYPYNNGHLLVAPLRHIADVTDATDEELLHLFKLVREARKALALTISPHGFNIGVNLGRCAGAGLPGHFHIHIVPRWDGDTNFMSVCSDTDVISQSMTELLGMLRAAGMEHGLPAL